MIHKPCRESTYTNCPAPKNCPPLALLPLMPPPSLQRFVYFINKKEVNILFSMSSESRCWWSKWYIHTIVLLFQKPGFYSLAACRVVLHCHHQWGHCIILSLIIVCLIKDFNTLGILYCNCWSSLKPGCPFEIGTTLSNGYVLLIKIVKLWWVGLNVNE